MRREDERVRFVDEEGQEHSFYLHRMVDVDGRTYVLLEPEDGDGELVVLRLEGPIDSGCFVTLEDEEWERVAEALEGEVEIE